MSRAELNDALLEARKNMKSPPMNGVGHAGKNGSREYKYALLSDVISCVLPPLMEQGVMLTQRIVDGELKTVAMKGQEEVVLDSRKVNLSGTSQEQGSAETYAKRYALCTVFCLCGIEDDDGEASSSRREPIQSDYTSNAKRRMWKAIQNWAAIHSREPKDVLEGVQKRPEWSETADFFEAVAIEFEQDMSNG